MKANCKIVCLYFALFIASDMNVSAQDQQPPPATASTPAPKKRFRDRIYIGGNLGLQFGTTTVVNLSPQVGYRVTDKFIPGVGVTYIYYSEKNPYTNTRYETNIYGGDIFAKYFFTDNLFGHVEGEQLNREVYDPFLAEFRRVWVPSLYAGGGYSYSIGGRASIELLILFELLQDRYGPYYHSNPVIRIGFGF